MVETHIGAVPIRPVFGAADPALRRPRRRKSKGRRKMRLADQRGVVATPRQRPGKSAARGFRRQVDAIVGDAMRSRQQACQDRGPRRLAHQTGRDAAGKMRTRPRHRIEMRRLHLAALKSTQSPRCWSEVMNRILRGLVTNSLQTSFSQASQNSRPYAIPDLIFNRPRPPSLRAQAKQSSFFAEVSEAGLLRRFAPRNGVDTVIRSGRDAGLFNVSSPA